MVEDNTNLIVGAGALALAGSIATAIWSIMRLNTVVKDKGASEQKIIDRLDVVEKGQGRVFKKLEELQKALHNAETKGTEEHGKIKELISESKLTTLEKIASLSERVTSIESGGCTPAKKGN